MAKFVSVVFDIPINQSYTYKNPEGLEAVVGSRVCACLKNRETKGFVIETSNECSFDEDKIKPYTEIIDKEPLFDEKILALAKWMSGMYFCSLGEALSAMMPTAEKELKRKPDNFDIETIAKKAVIPSEEQINALQEITSQESGTWYLYGPTGTGKTEVFLEVAEKTIEEGRGVIYLVPEISLTAQVIESVSSRFGKQCAVIHSGLSAQKKLTEWKRIQSGEARIIVGARSAIFAPVKNLGLIILDEEHENSYKAGSTPRYHARQVAMKRSVLEKTRFVMGSATPSVEAWHLVETGALKKLSLTKRLAGGDMPTIEIVDMRAEKNTFSQPLIDAMRKIKESGNQTILFLNRRGFSYFWQCKSCGAEIKCKNCSVGLTYHKERNKLICHYCGYQAIPPKKCPQCGSLDISYSGFGTERIEEEAKQLFPEMSIVRVDTDSMSKKGVLEKTLTDFRDGKIDVLLGTQMVAKGLNFPKVRLVGIILADTSLNIPDFRAAERTFSLVTQVAGRAGRFEKGGLVMLQTYRPSLSILRHAMNHDINSFYSEELSIRKELGFPPFSRLLRIVIRSKNADEANKIAYELFSRLHTVLQLAQKTDDIKNSISEKDVEILGPSECPIAVVSGSTRIQILLRSKLASSSRAVFEAARRGFKVPSAVYIEVDPDPTTLL